MRQQFRSTPQQVAIEIGQWTEKNQERLSGNLGARLIAARKRKMEREAASK